MGVSFLFLAVLSSKGIRFLIGNSAPDGVVQKSEYEISVGLLGRARHQIFDVEAVLFVEQGQRGSGGRTRSARAYDGPLTLTDTADFCMMNASSARKVRDHKISASG